MYENAKPCIVMLRVFIKTCNSYDFRKYIHNNISITSSCLKNCRNTFFIDICTRRRKSFKNIYLNICSHRNVFELIPTILMKIKCLFENIKKISLSFPEHFARWWNEGRNWPTTTISSLSHILLIFSSESHRNPLP